MKSIAILTLAVVAATAGSALAQQAAPEHMGGKHPGHFEGRKSLDTNKNGVINRAEAAAMPRFAAMFDKLDSNKDGRLDATERAQLKSRHGKRGMKGHRMRHHGRAGIARLDVDGDGRISRDEIARMPKFAGKFAQIDGNRDGYLVRTEVQAYRERMRPQRIAERNKRFDQHFASADLNKDGKLSKIEVDEKMPRMAKGFAWMDEDRDGFLNRSELQPRHR